MVAKCQTTALLAQLRLLSTSHCYMVMVSEEKDAPGHSSFSTIQKRAFANGRLGSQSASCWLLSTNNIFYRYNIIKTIAFNTILTMFLIAPDDALYCQWNFYHVMHAVC